jgi:hypothetical protein
VRSCDRAGVSLLPSIEDIRMKKGICRDEEVQKENICCSCCIILLIAVSKHARLSLGDRRSL